MYTRITHMAALGVMALILTPGCASMQRGWDGLTGSSEKNDHKQTTVQATVDLNSAGHKRLAALPGLTGDDADRIITNRPYANRRDLVRKGVLSENAFDRIRDEVYVDNAKN